MPRICTTVDADLDRRLSAEARRRRITRARLLREAAVHYLGAAEADRVVGELQRALAVQTERLERIERELGLGASQAAGEPLTNRGTAAGRG